MYHFDEKKVFLGLNKAAKLTQSIIDVPDT